MIELLVTSDDVNKRDRYIDEYYETGQNDWSNELLEARKILIRDLKNRDLEIRRLGKQLSLQSEVTKTSTFVGSISGVDRIERLRLVVDVISLSGSFTFALYGTNNDGADYTLVDTLTIDENKTASKVIDNPFKKYRLDILTAGNSITYSAYMYETTFDDLLVYKALSIAYYDLYNGSDNSLFKEKSEYYDMMYVDLLNVTNLPYDEDDSGAIDTDEEETKTNRVVFRP